MAVKALKEKLEEKLLGTENDNSNVKEAGSTNIVPFSKPEPQVISVVPDFVITLAEAKQRIAMLQQFVKDMMIPGQDYGIIPKCDKPSLFKAGAEKLTDIFGFSKHIEVVNRVEDWEKGLFHYEVKATLISKSTGHIEAEGVGSCNNREKKYATSPPCNIINTILKMAKKRAFIDAVLSATRSSGLFSQDLEDLEDNQFQSTSQTHSSELHVEPIPIPAEESQENHKPATRNQLNKIQALVSQKNITINKVKWLMNERYKVSESKHMSVRQADDFIKYLMKYSIR